jgi:hypothetical protein
MGMGRPMTFDLDLIKTLLGLFSIVGATTSGVAALVIDYKNKETGKITRWGRYALFGLGISFLIGACNLWIDYVEKSRATRNAAEESRTNSEKTLKILTDIERTLNPFKDVQIFVRFSYPFGDPDLLQYHQRLDTGIGAILHDISLQDDPDDPNQKIQGVNWSQKDADGSVLSVRINTGSPLLPNPSEPLAAEVYFRRGLTVFWFKSPVDPTTFDEFQGAKPDIKMSLSPNEDHTNRIDMDYDPIGKMIEFQGSHLQAKPEYWNSSGQIVSLLDLPGSQLIVQLEFDEAVTFFHNVPSKSVPLKRIKMPDSLFLGITIAERRPWFLSKNEFKKYVGPLGTTNYVYTFPKIYSELFQDK